VPDEFAPLRRGGRGWGDDVALLDEAEARRRLLAAAERCIVRRGSAHIRMGEVATEAGVARSTLYRYFPTRGELIVGLFLDRIDVAMEAVVSALPEPGRAAASLPDLVLRPLTFIEGNPLNEALFSAESRALVASWELGSEALFEAVYRHFGPLLVQWRAAGQLHDDLDLGEVVRWIETLQLSLLSEPWRDLSSDEQRQLLVRFLVRAVVPASHW
jgi:AcrR family transcriptional regulator